MIGWGLKNTQKSFNEKSEESKKEWIPGGVGNGLKKAKFFMNLTYSMWATRLYKNLGRAEVVREKG